jgi:serine/threonine protein kinase/Tol biopolymer transport system component
MTPERWQQIKEVFNAALERSEPDRPGFIAEACAGDESLLSEVESLLKSHAKEGRFIDAPAYEVAAGVLINSQSMIAPGQSLGSYRILSTLGRGGMGEVYLAEDGRLGRKVALKLLPSSFTNDAERLARFEREARAASGLNHPNILTIYELGCLDGRQFIAAEYVEGENLRQRQAHSPLKLSEVLDLAIQVASALAAAHQAGIVHRDIKPENLMLRRDGYAKVVDFGLAKLTQAARGSADTSVSTVLQVDTGTGVVMGTTTYMSPEQARGMELDARTDIWSLGVVLYETLSGAPPFKGSTQSDLIVSILEREPAPLITTPLVPSEVDWIIRKALRKDREERYQTARELLGDLRGLKQQLEFAGMERSAASDAGSVTHSVRPKASFGEGQNGGLATAGTRIVANTEIEQTLTGSKTTLVRRTFRNRTIAIAGVLAVLVIAAGIAYKFWPGKKVTPFRSMTIARLTNSGKVIDTTLSPDGKYIVYALSDAGKQSLWIRQVSTANEKLIVPPAAVGFFGMTFSPDGNDLYYAIKAMVAGTLYRIPALGGTPVKILEGVDAPVSFSPDGKQLVLVRGKFPNPGDSALVIANIDGTGQRTLAVRKEPEQFAPVFFTGPSWSPDGKVVASTVSSLGTSSHVFAFSVADGKATDLTPDPWSYTARVAWLPDMSGLLVIAGEGPGLTQVWFLSYPSGERQRITNDLNAYRTLGLAAEGSKFSTIQTNGLVNLWIAPDGDAKRAIQLPTGNVGFFGQSGSSVAWTPDDNIVFVSTETGHFDLWLMDSKGQNRRQLTTNAGQNFGPVVSRDGRYVVFTSNRTGNRNIWRMKIDGSDPTPLSHGVSDGLATISPDSRWVFYSSVASGKPTLWRVSIDGGTPVQLTSRPATTPTVSPDGKFIVYLYPDSPDSLAPPNRMAIMPIEGGDPIKSFAFQGPTITGTWASWSQDGRSIFYTVSNNNVTNIWSQPVEGGPPKQVTDFKDSLMTGFSWSGDGKMLACTRGILLRDVVLVSDSK